MELERIKELAEQGTITQTQLVEYYTNNPEKLAELSEEDLLNLGLVTIVNCPELDLEESDDEDEDQPVTTEEYSVYKITNDCPSEITVGKDQVVNVSLSTESIKDKGYSNVQFKFTTQTPEDGQMTFKANDSLGSPFEFVNNGTWGPEGGFPIAADYSATTQWTINASAEGQYTCNIELVDVANENTVIASSNISVNVVAVPTEPEEMTE